MCGAVRGRRRGSQRAPRVAGDAALARLRRRRLVRAVGHGEHDDAANAVEHVPRMGVGFAAVGEVVHVAGIAAGEPLVEPLRRRRLRAGQIPQSAKPSSRACDLTANERSPASM